VLQLKAIELVEQLHVCFDHAGLILRNLILELAVKQVENLKNNYKKRVKFTLSGAFDKFNL